MLISFDHVLPASRVFFRYSTTESDPHCLRSAQPPVSAVSSDVVTPLLTVRGCPGSSAQECRREFIVLVDHGE